MSDLLAIRPFPVPDTSQEGVALFRGSDTHDISKDHPQLLGIHSLRIGPAPGETLSLDMHQAPLDGNTWPQGSNHSQSLGVAVGREALRGQAPLFQGSEEADELSLRVLSHIVLTGDDRVGRRIHQGDDTFRPVEEGAVKDHVLHPFQRAGVLGWRAGQPVADDPTQPLASMATLVAKLPDRVAFDDPFIKPYPFSIVCPCPDSPMKRALTCLAQ